MRKEDEFAHRVGVISMKENHSSEGFLSFLGVVFVERKNERGKFQPVMRDDIFMPRILRLEPRLFGKVLRIEFFCHEILLDFFLGHFCPGKRRVKYEQINGKNVSKHNQCD